MSIRKRQQGDQYFRFEFQFNGNTYRGTFNGKDGSPVPATAKEAELYEAAIKLKVRQGTYTLDAEIPQSDPLETFGAFFDQVYFPYCKNNLADWKHAESRGAILKEFFAGMRFDDITKMVVVRFVTQQLNTKTNRGELYGPVTVSKYVALACAVFEMAIGEGKATHNPCKRKALPKAIQKKIPPRIKRERFLTDDEERRLFDQLKGRRLHLFSIVRLALETGARKSEIFRVEVNHVNLSCESRWIRLPTGRQEIKPNSLLIARGKNGKPHLVPLTATARQIVECQINDATTKQYLFTSPRTGKAYTDIKTAFRAAIRAAEIEDFKFHDLRHTFNTWMAEAQADPYLIRDVLGHSTIAMSADYTHTNFERRRAAVSSMSQKRRTAQAVDPVKIPA